MKGIPEGLTGREILNFGYLKAVYSLNTFYGSRVNPAGHFKTKNETVCTEVIKKGGNIVDMYKSGADALYCALLSDPHTDERLLRKTVDQFIPF